MLNRGWTPALVGRLIICLFLLSALVGCADEVTVPDVTGMTSDEAIEALQAADLGFYTLDVALMTESGGLAIVTDYEPRGVVKVGAGVELVLAPPKATTESSTRPSDEPAAASPSAADAPSRRCIEAFKGVAAVDFEDSAAYDRAYIATTEACPTFEDWVATLREYPETIGYRPDATAKQLEGEIYLVCIPMRDTPVCRDAKRSGVLD